MALPRVALLLALIVVLPAIWSVTHSVAEAKSDANAKVDAELKPEAVGSKTDDQVAQREEERMSATGFSAKEAKMLREKAETHQFQAEVNQLMNILINSLYTQTEVFLREVISNASDALDKIRFLSLTDKSQLDSGSELKIQIRADKEKQTLEISDTGVGMTRQDLVNALGTIAQSGTAAFLQKHKTAQGDTSLIGQFGVGFYSVFLVADHVTVLSKHNDDKQHVWQSDSKGSFTVAEDPRGNTLGRGTKIVLHIKDDHKDFLSSETLEALVHKYSQFINFPIYLWKSHKETKEVPLTEEEIQKEKDERQKKKDEAKKKDEDEEEISLDDKPKEEKKEEAEEEPIPTMKSVEEDVWNYELMNETKPIWVRTAKDVTEQEYKDFYKTFTKDTEEPLAWQHFSAEGEVEFKSLLYVPGQAPTNQFDPSAESSHKGIKLYVRRVFITDQFSDILPKYLNFIKGVVDSDDLPLNVSREMLQEHRILKIIKKKLVRKAIALLQELAEKDEEKFLKVYKNYSTNIKLGVIEDVNNRTRLSKLMRFHSSKTGEMTSLDKYLERKKEGQNQIYYIGGESKEAVQRSPLLERLVKKGYEVLFMVDPIDEYAMSNLEKYDGKWKITNIGKEGLVLDGDKEDEEKLKQQQEEYKPLLDFLQKSLGDKIDHASLSKRLSSSPSALVSPTWGYTANMERIIRAQALGQNPDQHRAAFAPKRVLELNPRHPVVKRLKDLVAEDAESATAKDVAQLMYETAALTSGYALDDPAAFAGRITRMMSSSLNLDTNAQADEEPEAPTEEKKADAEKSESHSVKEEL